MDFVGEEVGALVAFVGEDDGEDVGVPVDFVGEEVGALVDFVGEDDGEEV